MIELTQEELKQHFSEPIFGQIAETADTLGMECYVVGGYVRDIFLQRPSKDIDVVVVGSGIAMAEALGKQLGRGAHVSVFKNFGTAQVKYRGTEVEFVGARKESYQRDSRKPIVEDGTLEDDQNRRDFTINALAVCLNKARFGELVDPFGGLEDMKEKTIRTPLDPDITFSDDPLRMMRCIRFATQLGFYIDDDTFESLCRNKERIESEDILTPVPSEELEPVEDDKKQVKKEDEKENDAKVDKEQKGTTSPANKVQTMEYTVSSGETYSSIARKFNTTVAILMQLNHTKDARLNAGDTIWVPKK